jgi:hypothetical protein
MRKLKGEKMADANSFGLRLGPAAAQLFQAQDGHVRETIQGTGGMAGRCVLSIVCF